MIENQKFVKINVTSGRINAYEKRIKKEITRKYVRCVGL